MVTFKEMKVQRICEDKSLSREQKIDALLEIESEARDLQRAASESPMNSEDGWEADLREVRKALDMLGWEKPARGAATL